MDNMSATAEADTKELQENLLASFQLLVAIDTEDEQTEKLPESNKKALDLVVKSCRTQKETCLQESKKVKQNIEEKYVSMLSNQRKLVTKKEETSSQITRYYARLRDKINVLLRNEEQKFQDQLNAMTNSDDRVMEEKIGDCKLLFKTFEDNVHVVDQVVIGDSIDEEKCMSLITLFDKLKEQFSVIERKMSNMNTSVDDMKFVPDCRKEKNVLTPGYAEWKLNDQSSDRTSSRNTPAGAGHSAGAGHYVPRYPGEEKDPRSPSPFRQRSLIEDSPVTTEEPPPYDQAATCAPTSYYYADRLGSFDTMVKGDQRKPKIGGICWIKNRILVCDRYNRKLKIFADNGDILFALLFPEGEPWDVTPGFQEYVPLQTDSCFMTIPTSKQMVRVRVYPDDKLELVDRFKTKVGYSCIAYNKSNASLICGVGSSFDKPRVDILGLKGELCESFAMDSNRQPLFDFPRSVNITDDGVISICDWNKNRVLFLRKDGFILGAYRGTKDSPLKEPRGIAPDEKGYLMIADGKSHSVHIVDMSGNFVGVLQIDKPLEDPEEIDITTWGEDPKLAVSYRGHYVKVYLLS